MRSLSYQRKLGAFKRHPAFSKPTSLDYFHPTCRDSRTKLGYVNLYVKSVLFSPMIPGTSIHSWREVGKRFVDSF